MNANACVCDRFSIKEQGTACVRELCGWKGLSAHVGRERELSHTVHNLRSIAIHVYLYAHVAAHARVTEYYLVENSVTLG